VGSGYQELGALALAEVALTRGWSDAQTYNAQRLIDGGMGERLGYKSFERTTFGGGIEEEALEGERWVYYLYEERVEEVEELI
jgi:hypothetical protein